MTTKELYERALPFVVSVDVRKLERDGIAFQLTYATTKERFERRQWDTATCGVPLAVANELLKALLKETATADDLVLH